MQGSSAAIAQSANLFMFVMHNPVRFTDPTGLFAILPSGLKGPGMSPGLWNIVNQVRTATKTATTTASSTATALSPSSSATITTYSTVAVTTNAPAIAPTVSIWNWAVSGIGTRKEKNRLVTPCTGGGGRGSGGSGSGGTTTKPPVTVHTIPGKTTLTSSASTPGKGGVTPVGRAFQKHNSRPDSVFTGNQTGNTAKNTQQGMAHLEKILNDPNSTFTVRNTKAHGDVLDVRMPCGKGARWTPDGSRFIGFLEP